MNEQKIEKSGAAVDAAAVIRLIGEDLKYVSRGGLKLEKALDHWQIDVSRQSLCRRGGFNRRFHRLSVAAARRSCDRGGYRTWPDRFPSAPGYSRRLLEKTNARYLTREQIGEPVDLVVMDVSFISATLVLPAVIAASSRSHPAERKGRQIIVLVKPQFEAGVRRWEKADRARPAKYKLPPSRKFARRCWRKAVPAPTPSNPQSSAGKGIARFLLTAGSKCRSLVLGL